MFCAGNILHMKYPHPNYTPFDVDNPFSPDVKGQEGGAQNKFLNRAAAYYMYRCFPVSCLGRLMPDSSSPADIGALCSKEIPAAPGSASKIKMMSPELLAILAAYIQISPWRDHNFKSQADTAPPLQEYYDTHFAYFNSFKREFCREKIEKCLREFFCREKIEKCLREFWGIPQRHQGAAEEPPLLLRGRS